MADTTKRPFGVTMVFIVILISGIFQVVAGVARLFNRGENANVGLWAAIITILLGVIYLLVARGIANGSRMARVVVALITVLSIASAIWIMVTAPSLWVALLVQILLGLIVLMLLYSARATNFFRS
jgi:drug/metabolite transporter (DMT)-like permease